ncbi:MAG: hypothetical protein AAGU74_11785 [Bacillota bacterium]
MTRFKSKRLLSLLLVLMLVFSMLIVSASAEEPNSSIEEIESTDELPETETEEETHIHTDTDDDTRSSESNGSDIMEEHTLSPLG